MKRSLFVLLVLLAALAFIAVPATVTHAATGALCSSDPTSGPIGTVFHMTCVGFDPNVIVNAYYVEPDGAASTYGPLKTDANGSVSFSQGTNFGDSTLGLGWWQIVVEETGLAKSVIYRGTAAFRVTGGTEGVKGATVWVNPTKTVQSLHFSSVIVYGTGFDPNEVVTVWMEQPNGECSSFTEHFEGINFADFNGLSTFFLADAKTDSTGSFSVDIGNAGIANCEGDWHIVGRGNNSHRGGETTLRVVGSPVTTNAALSASPSVALALDGVITFSGSGFGSSESVSCWLTSPQAQTTLFFPTAHSDAGGNVSFTMTTGSHFIFDASEGALGAWSMSCRGNTSGRTAIAEFKLYGAAVDP